MPFIQVTMVEGRTAERRRQLIRELSETTARVLDVPVDRVRIALYNVSGDDWGIAGVPHSIARGASADPTGQ